MNKNKNGQELKFKKKHGFYYNLNCVVKKNIISFANIQTSYFQLFVYCLLLRGIALRQFATFRS